MWIVFVLKGHGKKVKKKKKEKQQTYFDCSSVSQEQDSLMNDSDTNTDDPNTDTCAKTKQQWITFQGKDIVLIAYVTKKTKINFVGNSY